MKSVINLVTALGKKDMNNPSFAEAKPVRYTVEACFLTDVGCLREHNEDSILCITPADAAQLDDKELLAIVADGMGGHQAGEVASQMAVDIIRRSYYQQQWDNPIKGLRQSFNDANQAIYQASHAARHLHGMGTTATALILKNRQACFAHVGDSRLYRLRDAALTLLTQDHTLVMEMLKNGLITAKEARHHPQKNIILRALGTRPDIALSTSQNPLPVELGDYFILCSDGLYDLVDDSEIQEMVMANAPHAACNQLIALAKQRGGYDNISVGILAIQTVDKAVKKTPDTRESQAPPG